VSQDHHTTIECLAAGFHAVAHLPGYAGEAEVVACARERGVGLYGMSLHRASGRTSPPQLVLGFGNLTDRAIVAGLREVAYLLR
jgi:GntR family transcriptional regulator/MocR family aminotransferase